MTTRITGEGDLSRPIGSLEDAAAYLLASAKPRAERRIGMEYERFALRNDAPLDFDAIEAVFLSLAERGGWEPVRDGGRVVALERDCGAVGGCESIALEPGGQVEVVTRPEPGLATLEASVRRLVAETDEAFAAAGARLVGVGCHPTRPTEEIPWMPKGRYEVMREVLAAERVAGGGLGHTMMKATAGIQTAFDYDSEEEAMEMLRAALLIAPIARVAFASEDRFAGRPTKWKTYRAEIWRRTDPARTGLLPRFQEKGASLVDYLAWVAQAPLLFVERDGKYKDAHGARLGDRIGKGATAYDLESALTQVFPIVRLKRFLEVRPHDSLPPDRVREIARYWTGLLYDEDARAEAIDRASQIPADARASLAVRTARDGFQGTPWEKLSEILGKVSQEGLVRLAARGEAEAAGEAA